MDVEEYCRRAMELYNRLCNCYTTDHVESVIQDQLDRMQANKISIQGNLYFIPNPYLPLLNILEDSIDAIRKLNLNDGLVMSNSMFVVDDERQRQKMTDEFYANYKTGYRILPAAHPAFHRQRLRLGSRDQPLGSKDPGPPARKRKPMRRS